MASKQFFPGFLSHSKFVNWHTNFYHLCELPLFEKFPIKIWEVSWQYPFHISLTSHLFLGQNNEWALLYICNMHRKWCLSFLTQNWVTNAPFSISNVYESFLEKLTKISQASLMIHMSRSYCSMHFLRGKKQAMSKQAFTPDAWW